MGVNIAIVDKNLNIMKNFGYINDKSVDQILKIAAHENFQCLIFLDKCDHTFFNNKQWPQLFKEIEILNTKKNVISNELIASLVECYDEVIHVDNAYYAFIGD